jgi:hypothetical protein
VSICPADTDTPFSINGEPGSSILSMLMGRLGAQMDIDLNILPHLITGPVETIIRAIVYLTGNG